jgi:hypothetical protein
MSDTNWEAVEARQQRDIWMHRAEAAEARANAAEASSREYARRVAKLAWRKYTPIGDDGYITFQEALTRALAECTPEPLPENAPAPGNPAHEEST